MRILFVVQRYGVEVAGGAEVLCREVAERMAARGHESVVLTSCARDYDTWEDHYPEGVAEARGVEIVRLPVVRTRDPARFSALSQRVADPLRRNPVVEAAWMHEQGPILRGFGGELRRRSRDVDVVVFFTYLYPTTVNGLAELGGTVPVIVQPAAHDEWPIRLPLIRSVFDRADGLAYSTPEEQEFVDLRFRPTVPTEVIGIGFDPPVGGPPDVASFRRTYGLGDDPYVVCLGRLDPNKGSPEAIDFMAEYRRRHGGVRLVMCGADMMATAPRDGLVITGFVDDATRWAALAGAAVLLQPSRQESFGMTLAEGWLMDRPALVQRACEVTERLVHRSAGGLAYGGYAEFDAALGMLLGRPDLAARLGANGHRHVLATYTWDVVLSRYEHRLERVVTARSTAAGRDVQSTDRRPTTA